MALETVVYPQYPFGYGCKEFYTSVGGGACDYEFDLEEDDKVLVGTFDNNMEQGLNGNWDSPSSSLMQNVKEWDPNSSPEACTGDRFAGDQRSSLFTEAPLTASSRRKRRRIKSCKNKDELENQRMTHIAVERNRRKQMNEYLAVIRSLMPASYVQRGDQASIIGGAINYVKELEQLLQTLEAQKRTTQQPNNAFSPLFANFFTFPQYSTRSNHCNNSPANEPMAENRSALADIEVTMAESYANLKILSKRRLRQLLKMVAGLQCLQLTVLHLNVTTVDQMVLYSLSVKVEDGCQLTTVDEIADAVHHLLERIQEESIFS
ncbi:hypothetical protein F0562_027737 [Nyssa sinensis]|uniref:BHLH domain-containing protein n=1 Tax=Nyssa sinensis TaxID=561372 RepID=A0A5J5B602_9ASTE|nr:hypothetical protein F0562_027737 [Nyssa sinensis]